jgi:hypothetical protein
MNRRAPALQYRLGWVQEPAARAECRTQNRCTVVKAGGMLSPIQIAAQVDMRVGHAPFPRTATRESLTRALVSRPSDGS